MSEKKKDNERIVIGFPISFDDKGAVLTEWSTLQLLSFGKEEGTVTNVDCPFCKNGKLLLVSAGPIGDKGPKELVEDLTGNQYEWHCSNPDCEWIFVGTTSS